MAEMGSHLSLVGSVQAAVFRGLKPDVHYTMKVIGVNYTPPPPENEIFRFLWKANMPNHYNSRTFFALLLS